jgi:PD-(D/E)XK endonuclease
MENTTTVGTRTEGMVLAALLKARRRVLLPFGGGARYDLAYDAEGVLVRVQCKTATLRNGAVVFNTRSLSREGKSIPYDGDADFFGVYCPGTGEVYLVPVGVVAKGKGSLRVEPTKNNQVKGVLFAKDYLLV